MSYPLGPGRIDHTAARAVDYPVEPELDPPGSHQLARLNKMIADLKDAGETLTERISPILEPTRPRPGDPAVVMAAAAAREPSELESALNRLQEKITAIRETTDRVIL